MPHIEIRINYEPELADYPTHDDNGREIKSAFAAMEFDAANIENGNSSLDELMEAADSYEIKVVADE